jgi:hypothetical protein
MRSINHKVTLATKMCEEYESRKAVKFISEISLSLFLF